jgi:nucleoid-associated protein YgaU
MRKFTFAAIMFVAAGWARAQEIPLLESGPSGEAGKSAAVPSGGTSTVILPSEDKPAALPAAVKTEKFVPAMAPKPAAAGAPPPAVGEVGPGSGFAVTKTHKVARGDTLWDLSARYYQDPFKWGKIYNANLNVVSNPDLINPEEELLIPEITESVRPEPQKTSVIGEADTVKDAELSSSEAAQPEAAAAAPVEPVVVAPVKTAAAELSDALGSFDRADLSEDMPEHQREWSDGVKVVPDDWSGDGVITAKEKGADDSMENSLSMAGDTVTLFMSRSGLVKKGDYLKVYLKGADAYDKSGKKLGREIQAAGTLEVLSADNSGVRARVVEAVTPISKGYVVKKK